MNKCTKCQIAPVVGGLACACLLCAVQAQCSPSASMLHLLHLSLMRRRNAATLFSADKKLVALCEEMKLDCVAEEPL